MTSIPVSTPGETVQVPAGTEQVLDTTLLAEMPVGDVVAFLEAKGFTVTAPSPSSSKPVWGWFHGSPIASPVSNGIELDYADNGATTYTFTPTRLAYCKGKRLMLKVGALTVAQATAIAQTLVANGQADAIVPIMWEDNQGVSGWENAWNENADTAAQFIALFNSICASMRAVAGAKFTFAWCPNVNQAGNQKTGRNQFDTHPGTGVNGDVVVAPDGYDEPGDTGSQTADVLAQYEAYETFAASKGARFAGLCECGNNGADNPTYWKQLLEHAEANGWEFVTCFSATAAQGASFNSVPGANSVAAIEAFYA